MKKNQLIKFAYISILGLGTFGVVGAANYSTSNQNNLAFAKSHHTNGEMVMNYRHFSTTKYHAVKGTLYSSAKLTHVAHYARNYPHTTFYSSTYAHIMLFKDGSLHTVNYVYNKSHSVKGWINNHDIKKIKATSSKSSSQTSTPSSNPSSSNPSSTTSSNPANNNPSSSSNPSSSTSGTGLAPVENVPVSSIVGMGAEKVMTKHQIDEYGAVNVTFVEKHGYLPGNKDIKLASNKVYEAPNTGYGFGGTYVIGANGHRYYFNLTGTNRDVTEVIPGLRDPHTNWTNNTNHYVLYFAAGEGVFDTGNAAKEDKFENGHVLTQAYRPSGYKYAYQTDGQAMLPIPLVGAAWAGGGNISVINQAKKIIVFTPNALRIDR